MAAPPPRPSVARPAAGQGAPAGLKGDPKVQGTFFLGRYRVVEEIGIGGMASVHLARMDGPGGFQKWVAIKRIHANLVEDDQFVDMFLDEARIAAGINHANVAQVFDLGKDDNTYWIAMEYLHGEPLREVMRRCEERGQLISPDLAARICADAAEGLHAAHELRGKNGQLLGLVHRDVTPHNLFVTYDGYTKVVDFGIAKVADRLSETRAGTLKGKLAYMSPEQVRAQDDVDRTTDVFALGVVLWELTTGHRLFRMDTDLDTLEKVQACIVPPPSTIIPGYPVELESVVMKALAKKKAERFQTARELSRALQTYLLRRGVFVGPEEVAAFVRDLFGDRIKSREDHLAWAADVTSTINIDALKASKLNPARRDDTNLSEDGQPTGKKSPSGPPGARRHKSIPAAKPGAIQAAPPPPPTRPQGAPPPPPPNRPTADLTPEPPRSQPGSMSLIEDDEDVPTTVATRDHVAALGAALPPPPALAGSGGQLAPGAVPPPNIGRMTPGPPQSFPAPVSPRPAPQPTPAQQQPPPQRNVPHGGTFALTPEQNPVYRATFGGGAAPQSQPQPYAQAPTFGAPSFGALPPTTSGAQGLPGFGPPPNSSFSAAAQAQQNAMRMSQAPMGQGVPPSYGFAGQQGGVPSNGVAAHQQPNPQIMPSPHQVPQRNKETVFSQQRPDMGQWLNANELNPAQQSRKNTAVLVAVALLTAICVAAIAALIWLKLHAPAP